MNRRSFLVGAVVAPGAAFAALPPVGGIRVSCEEGDPGYRDFCVANGDSKVFKVWLDGVEQKKCVMADERLGVVKRMVTTPSGNIAHDGDGNIFFEEISGAVKVEMIDRPPHR